MVAVSADFDIYSRTVRNCKKSSDKTKRKINDEFVFDWLVKSEKIPKYILHVFMCMRQSVF